jgi:FG-GAP repeat
MSISTNNTSEDGRMMDDSEIFGTDRVLRTRPIVACVIAAILFIAATPVFAFSEVAKLVASDGESGDQFGWTVSVSGDTAVIGGMQDDDDGTNSGSTLCSSAIAPAAGVSRPN